MSEQSKPQQRLRKDARERHERLVALIEETVKEYGELFESYRWAARPQQDWAEMLGVSTRTLRDLCKVPPIQTTTTQVEGQKAVLLRVGEAGKPTPREQANLMKAIWRNKLKRGINPKQAECVRRLALLWPDGYQVEIFKAVLDDWPGFMVLAKLYIAYLREVEGETELFPTFLEYPSITYLRRFHNVGPDFYLSTMQNRGKFIGGTPFPWGLPVP